MFLRFELTMDGYSFFCIINKLNLLILKMHL